MIESVAVKAEKLTKTYRLYNSNADRVKEALHPFRRKYHHEFKAVNDVSFEIMKGDSVGIIGRNGSGKSTLLKLITGVLTPTSGTVQVNGRVSALLELGSGFNPELTGIENVYFNGTLMGYCRDEIDNRLDDVLAFADIGEFIHQPVKSYSSGMFVRLAFAVAVSIVPDILIIDEALAVGDLLFRKKCKEKMNWFKENGATIILVTHSLSEVKAMCSKCIYIDSGEMKVFGTASDAINEYLVAKDSLHSNNVVEQNTQEDRFGTGDIVISAVHCYQESSKPGNNIIQFGANIVVAIEFKVINAINNPIIRINIGSRGYAGLASIDNVNHGAHYNKLDGSGTIVITLSEQRLYPGNYFIDLGIVSEFINIHYFVWNAATVFTILPPNDRLLCAPYALVEIDANYSIERD